MALKSDLIFEIQSQPLSLQSC